MATRSKLFSSTLALSSTASNLCADILINHDMIVDFHDRLHITPADRPAVGLENRVALEVLVKAIKFSGSIGKWVRRDLRDVRAEGDDDPGSDEAVRAPAFLLRLWSGSCDPWYCGLAGTAPDRYNRLAVLGWSVLDTTGHGMKQASVGWVRIVLTFLLLGPPIGAITYTTVEQFILPVPGLLGFYERASLTEALGHYGKNLALGLMFGFIAAPVALGFRPYPECREVVRYAPEL